MTPSTEKVRLHRLRQKRGQVVLTIAVSQNVIDRLVRGQFLSEWHCDDKATVTAALERFLEIESSYK